MSKTNKTEHLKRAMIEALEKTLGVVTTACRQVGVGRTTFYQWMKFDELFAEEVNSISDIALDFAESKLYEQIRENNTTATIFYLKTKGRQRGYVERMNVVNENDYENQFAGLSEEDVKMKLREYSDKLLN